MLALARTLSVNVFLQMGQSLLYYSTPRVKTLGETQNTIGFRGVKLPTDCAAGIQADHIVILDVL